MSFNHLVFKLFTNRIIVKSVWANLDRLSVVVRMVVMVTTTIVCCVPTLGQVPCEVLLAPCC